MSKDGGKAAKAELVKILMENDDDGLATNPNDPTFVANSRPQSVNNKPANEIEIRFEPGDDDGGKTSIVNSTEAPTRVEIPRNTGQPKSSAGLSGARPPMPPLSKSPNIEVPPPTRAANISPSEKRRIESAPLLQSEHLRIAQERIRELEDVVESLRLDNEGLASAAETLKNRNDDLLARLDTVERRMRELNENQQRERELLEASVKSRNRENNQLKLRIEDLENRLTNDLRKVRVRERELENIIEIVRAEHAAVIVNKDEMILNLKRKIDEHTHQLENQLERVKDQDHMIVADQERIKRTVKALRVALVMLEGDDNDIGLKKVE